MAGTILLVDDSPTVRTLVKVYLTGLGYDYLEAGNGHEALDALKNTAVKLVIADVTMPGMDGFTFLEKVRTSASKELRGLPIILLTGEKSEESRSRGMKAGANAVVHKPVTTNELRNAVEKALA